jgi:hypothetical protein
MIDVAKEELFSVIKQPEIPLSFIEDKVSSAFVMERKYYYPHDNEQHEFVNIAEHHWRITQLSGIAESSEFSLFLSFEQGRIQLRIVAISDFQVTSKTLGEWPIIVERHVDQVIAELPALVEQAHEYMFKEHYNFCVKDYKINKKEVGRKTLEQILDFSEDVLAKSIHPLKLQ